MYRFFYGKREVNEKKTNNWKKWHGIPIKANCNACLPNGDILGPVVVFPLEENGPKRSTKKRKKHHFRHTWNAVKAIELQDKPELWRIYNRYGYTRKKLRRKTKRLQRQTLTCRTNGGENEKTIKKYHG